jgi:hypothetical protein
MATNEQFDWRQSDRRVYAFVAVLFTVIVKPRPAKNG